MIEDKELLKRFNNIWNKTSISMKKGFDSEPIYNKKFLKTKIKSYDMRLQTFMIKFFSKISSNYTFLAVILIDFVLKRRRKLLSASKTEKRFIKKKSD